MTDHGGRRRHIEHAGRLLIGLSVISSAASWALTGPARAGDLSITSNLSERVEYDDNFTVAPTSPGHVYKSLARAAIDVVAAMKSMEFSFQGNFLQTTFDGPGETRDLDSLDKDFHGAFHQQGKRNDLTISGSVAFADTSTAELEDTGLLGTGDATRISRNISGSDTYQLNSRNTVTLSADWTDIDFEGPSSRFTPTTRINIDGEWVHQLNRRTEVNVTFGYGQFIVENAQDSRSDIYEATGGMTVQLTENISVTGSGGATIITSASTMGGSRDSTTSVGAIYDVGVTYVHKTGQVSFSASRAVSPSSLGELQNRTSAALDATFDINSASAISVSASTQRQESSAKGPGSLGTDRSVLSVSPIYSLLLARDWHMNMGYRYRRQETGGTTGRSNNFFVSLTRDLTVLP